MPVHTGRSANRIKRSTRRNNDGACFIGIALEFSLKSNYGAEVVYERSSAAIQVVGLPEFMACTEALWLIKGLEVLKKSNRPKLPLPGAPGTTPAGQSA